MGGRLVLLKSVLFSIMVYFQLILQGSNMLISSLESLFKVFFCVCMCVCGGGGGGEATRKTNWISWIMYVYIRKKGAYVCEETFLLMVVIML
jgi:hypothetical protein